MRHVGVVGERGLVDPRFTDLGADADHPEDELDRGLTELLHEIPPVEACTLDAEHRRPQIHQGEVVPHQSPVEAQAERVTGDALQAAGPVGDESLATRQLTVLGVEALSAKGGQHLTDRGHLGGDRVDAGGLRRGGNAAVCCGGASFCVHVARLM